MFLLPSPLEKMEHPLLAAHNVQLYIKRDDLIHNQISGNKWRKLKYNLEQMKLKEYAKMVTFGGAYSNHIAATAAAAHHFGYHVIGVIRGEELNGHINPTLEKAAEQGMEFRFVNRDQFRNMRKDNYAYVHEQCPDGWVIPEGGANALGMKGVAEIIDELDVPFDTIITAVGTGTTLAGLVQGLKGRSHVLGVSVVGGNFLEKEVSKLLEEAGVNEKNYSLTHGYHFGGYAKTKPDLLDFINEMTTETALKLDPIYTGKAFYGVWDMIKNGTFDHQTLVFLHTGGLQGIAGFNQKSPQKIHN